MSALNWMYELTLINLLWIMTILYCTIYFWTKIRLNDRERTIPDYNSNLNKWKNNWILKNWIVDISYFTWIFRIFTCIHVCNLGYIICNFHPRKEKRKEIQQKRAKNVPLYIFLQWHIFNLSYNPLDGV